MSNFSPNVVGESAVGGGLSLGSANRSFVGGGLSPDFHKPDTSIPIKGSRQLRVGRFSQPSTSYFLTICSQRGHGILAKQEIFDALLFHHKKLSFEKVWDSRVMVVMPDHLHMVIKLGGAQTLSGAVRLFKGRSSVDLRKHNSSWQHDGYFDHHIRPDEPIGSIFRYILMNPYRKKLLSADEPYPFFYCCPEDWIWFQHETKNGLPFPVWLGAEKV